MDTAEAGRKGGKAAAEALSAKERQDRAKKAIKARWDAFYKANPDKKKARKRKGAGK